MEEVTTLDLHSLRESVPSKEKPAFEIHISRAPCQTCMTFVGRLSRVTGLDMSIQVGAVINEIKNDSDTPESMKKKPDKEDVREQVEKFGPVPEDWPEDLRCVFSGAEGSGGAPREATSSSDAVPPPGDGDGLQAHGSSFEAPPQSSEKSGDASETKAEKAPADGDDDDDDDCQVISSFEYYHPRSAPRTPENQADQLYPSIETASQRTATTPNRSPLAVSPRTDMYMRSRRYAGPSYMQPRERSYIHKPRATPITTTPSEIRRRHP